MRLIVDTNVLFAFFGNKRIVEIFEKLRSKGVKLIVPEFVIEELDKLKGKIINRGIDEAEYADSFELLRIMIEPISKLEYERFLDEAKKISPHKKDVPLFALSLAFNKAPIWSREPRLRRQKIVEVLSDKEVEKLLKKSTSSS
jgi:predicted nucleic acid-binding protein